MGGTIPEVGIAEGNVTRSQRYLRPDIRQNNMRRNSEKATMINGGDRAMLAGVLTTARSLCIAISRHCNVMPAWNGMVSCGRWLRSGMMNGVLSREGPLLAERV